MAKPTTTTPVRTLLSGLKISNLKRSAASASDPAARARAKLLAGIAEQIRYAEAEMRGESYTPMRTAYVAGPDGQRVEQRAVRRRLIWYWKHGGTYYTEVRYGTGAVDLGGGTAVECGGNLDAVVATLAVIADAVRAGELDAELLASAAKRATRRRAE